MNVFRFEIAFIFVFIMRQGYCKFIIQNNLYVLQWSRRRNPRSYQSHNEAFNTFNAAPLTEINYLKGSSITMCLNPLVHPVGCLKYILLNEANIHVLSFYVVVFI